MTRRPSLIPDELLRQLMAAGQTDVLIGVPTLNNAATIEPVLAAVHLAVAEGFPQRRILIVNSDGGSDDGTPHLFSLASRSRMATLLGSHSLRTMHRVAAPFHGLPGKRAAVRTLFAAADLLQARTVVIVDATAAAPSAEALRTLVLQVLDGAADFAAPAPIRDPREGPLVTQVVKPVLKAVFGGAFDDPLGEEFVASGRFVADALRQRVWDDEPLRAGIDLWLRVHALAGTYATVQVRTPPRPRGGAVAPPLRTVVQQLLAAMWTCLDMYAPTWTRGATAADPVTVPAHDGAAVRPTWNLAEMEATCRAAVRDLEPIWRGVLSAPVLHAVRAAALSEPLNLPDDLWADVLVEFTLAWRALRLRPDDLGASFAPLYLGRAASFLRTTEALEISDARARLETLEQCVLDRRPRLIDAWHGSGHGEA